MLQVAHLDIKATFIVMADHLHKDVHEGKVAVSDFVVKNLLPKKHEFNQLIWKSSELHFAEMLENSLNTTLVSDMIPVLKIILALEPYQKQLKVQKLVDNLAKCVSVDRYSSPAVIEDFIALYKLASFMMRRGIEVHYIRSKQ